MTAVAVTKIGPVKARFKGKVHLTDLDPPNGYRISGEGDGGVAGGLDRAVVEAVVAVSCFLRLVWAREWRAVVIFGFINSLGCGAWFA